jgi:hypothetical protein
MSKDEIRIKSDTGGEKCSKLAQMADIPPSVLLELMEHYGKGREKYPGDAKGPNYTKGYPWSLSFNAAMRHLLQFWAGEDLDEETGSKHVIAAAWHCLGLALFMDIRKNQDDRWEKPIKRELLNGDLEEMKKVADALLNRSKLTPPRNICVTPKEAPMEECTCCINQGGPDPDCPRHGRKARPDIWARYDSADFV